MSLLLVSAIGSDKTVGCQLPSSARSVAGDFGFLTLIQSLDGPAF
jgi:hypothetical protein